MPINMKQILAYPCKRENVVRCVAIPAAIMCLAAIGCSLLFLMGGLMFQAMAQNIMMAVALAVGVFLLMGTLSSPVVGYMWHMMDHWQTNGLEASPLPWKGHVKSYCVSGLHFWATCLVFSPLMLLSMCTLGLMAPYMCAVIVQGARYKNVLWSIQNARQVFAMNKQQYQMALKCFYTCWALCLGCTLVSTLLSWTIVGPMCLYEVARICCMRFMVECWAGFSSTQNNADMAACAQQKEDGMAEQPCAVMETANGLMSESVDEPMNDMSFEPGVSEEPMGQAVMVYTAPDQKQKNAKAKSGKNQVNSPWTRHREEN
jgi:hypothetical protein